MTNAKMKMITFRDYEGIMNAVKKHAQANDLTVSQFIRRAIRKLMLDENKQSLTK